MKKRSKIIITVLVSAAIVETLAFSMIATYRKGHENGYTEGAKISTTDVDARIKSEYDKGYTEGKNDGYNNGKNDGYTEGKNDGYTEGKNYGYGSGYTDGENAGYNSGYNSGYSAGVSAGKSQASTSRQSASQQSTRNCFAMGCDRPCFSNMCSYCEYHKCAIPSCNSGASYNSYYCLMHG